MFAPTSADWASEVVRLVDESTLGCLVLASCCRQVLLSVGVLRADVTDHCGPLRKSFDHDYNGNARCDKNWIRLQEGSVGASSNPRILLASPDRAKAPLRSKARGRW